MERFLWMLLECTLTMSVLAGLLLLFTPRWTRRYSARSAYIAWLILLAGFLVVYRPHTAPAPLQVTVQPMRSVQVLPYRPAQPESDDPVAVQAQPERTAPVIAGPQTARTPRIDLPTALFTLWALGAAGSLALRLGKHRRFMRSVRRWRRPVTDPAVLAVLSEECANRGIAPGVALYTCRAIDSPMLIGLLRPQVLLPDVPLAPDALRLVLRHELVHCRRGDLWGRVLMLIASSLHWFNPLLPAILKAATFQCEASCDADVMLGLTMDARVRYSETILDLLRNRGAMTTALSTRYSGGKQTVKKRIQSILDMRPKKLGMVLAAVMLASAFALGMAFALATEVKTPVTPAERGLQSNASVNGESYLSSYGSFHLLAKANRKLDALAERFGEGRTHCVVNGIDFTALMALMDACDSPEAYAALLTHDLVVEYPDSYTELDPKIDAILAGMGRPALSGRTYSVSDTSYYDTAWKQTTTVLLYGETERDDSAVGMLLADDDSVLQIYPVYPAFFENTRPITDAERDAVRSAALSFAEGFGRDPIPEPSLTMVSDVVYENFGEGPYALVWIFNGCWWYSDDEGPSEEDYRPVYNDEMHDFNQGTQIAVSVTDGTIYSVNGGIGEIDFLHSAQAETDWVARTGLAYPFINSQYIVSYLSPSITSMIARHLEAYGKDLAPEALILAAQMPERLYISLTPESDWEALEAAMASVQNAEDFAAALQADYRGITTPTKGLTRAELLARADTILETLGWTDVPDRSLLVSGGYYQEEGAQIFAADISKYNGEGLMPGIFLNLDTDGNLCGVDGNVIVGEKLGRFSDLPEAEQADIRARLLAIAQETAAGDTITEDDIRIGDTLSDGYGLGRMLYAFIQAGERDYPSGSDAQGSYDIGMELSLNLEDGKVYMLINNTTENSGLFQ